jgi:hypothetical protein
MQLPFTHDAFLDVFGRYNVALWPAVLALWALTAFIAFLWVRRRRVEGRTPFVLLAAHWYWSGTAYHWSFFRDINPAATLFAALFVLQGALFTRLALAPRGAAIACVGWRGGIGRALVVYGLVYPLLGLGFGLEYPRLPLFAVPCPTTLITAGLLVASAGVPRVVYVVPILWAVVGSSAAFALGILADLALVAAGAVLVLDALAPRAPGRRAV